MSKIIFCGHGCYGEYFQTAVCMLMGEVEGLCFVDFLPGEDREQLVAKLEEAVESCGGEPILFVADLLGGLPFKQCAMLCMENQSRAAVAGLNLGVVLELIGNREKSPQELIGLAQASLSASFGAFQSQSF